MSDNIIKGRHITFSRNGKKVSLEEILSFFDKKKTESSSVRENSTDEIPPKNQENLKNVRQKTSGNISNKRNIIFKFKGKKVSLKEILSFFDKKKTESSSVKGNSNDKIPPKNQENLKKVKQKTSGNISNERNIIFKFKGKSISLEEILSFFDEELALGKTTLTEDFADTQEFVIIKMKKPKTLNLEQLLQLLKIIENSATVELHKNGTTIELTDTIGHVEKTVAKARSNSKEAIAEEEAKEGETEKKFEKAAADVSPEIKQEQKTKTSTEEIHPNDFSGANDNGMDIASISSGEFDDKKSINNNEATQELANIEDESKANETKPINQVEHTATNDEKKSTHPTIIADEEAQKNSSFAKTTNNTEKSQESSENNNKKRAHTEVIHTINLDRIMKEEKKVSETEAENSSFKDGASVAIDRLADWKRQRQKSGQTEIENSKEILSSPNSDK